MGVIATAAKHLIRAGLSGDDLLDAISEIEESLAAEKAESARIFADHKPRAKSNAERQAEWRERQRNESNAVTESVMGVTDGAVSVTKNNGQAVENAKQVTKITENVTGVTDVTQKKVSPTPPSKKTNPSKNPPKGGQKGFPQIEIPDWLDRQAWHEFCEHRRSMGKPLSDLAAKRAIRELGRFRESGLDPHRSIDEAIIAGWQGLFPPKGNAQAPPKRPIAALQ